MKSFGESGLKISKIKINILNNNITVLILEGQVQTNFSMGFLIFNALGRNGGNGMDSLFVCLKLEKKSKE